MTVAPHVLVIEDEHDLALGLRVNLEVEGHRVSLAHTLADGAALAAEDTPDLIVLDLMLPDGDGYELLANLRASGCDVPVLILTARAQEVDKVRGFRTGADDYVTKPFGVMELLVRIEALLRRTRSRGVPPAAGIGMESNRPLQLIGRVELDAEGRMLRCGEREVTLTPKAVELLLAMARRPGRAMSRQELLRDVWQYDAAVTTRTVDAHVAELRRKLALVGADPNMIDTVWKTGYRLRL